MLFLSWLASWVGIFLSTDGCGKACVISFSLSFPSMCSSRDAREPREKKKNKRKGEKRTKTMRSVRCVRGLSCVGQQESRFIPTGNTDFYPLSFVVEAYFLGGFLGVIWRSNSIENFVILRSFISSFITSSLFLAHSESLTCIIFLVSYSLFS